MSSTPPRTSRQVHIRDTDWSTLDARGGPRGRSAVIAALARALKAGHVANFDVHLAEVQGETRGEQAARMRALRGTGDGDVRTGDPSDVEDGMRALRGTGDPSDAPTPTPESV